MRRTRIFVDRPLRAGAEFVLANAAAHHISRVLRLRPGHPLILFDGHGGEYDAEISRLDKRYVEVHTHRHLEVDRESPLHITLVQGISRGQKMDFILQKAVELGIYRIVLVTTEFGNVRLDKERQQKKIEHWQNVVIGACEQCGRNKIPELVAPSGLDESFETGNRKDMMKVVLHPGIGKSLSELAKPKDGITLMAGPEGGFSDNEIEKARSAGHTVINIGPRILRTETTALAAVSVCQMLWGDFS